MALQRPVWTFCFFFVWVLTIPGVLLTHLSLVKLMPPIKELPQSLVKGIDETFKFKYLEGEAEKVKDAAKDALSTCDIPTNLCPEPTIAPITKKSDTAEQKKKIQDAFDSVLDVVQKFVDDPYFGVKALKPTKDALKDIVDQVQQLEGGEVECVGSTRLYCGIYEASGQIVGGMGPVTKQLDKFKNNEMVKAWNENQGRLVILHAMPYIAVIGLLFFTCFWYKGGVCCCCRDGTIAALALIPYTLLWLAAFIIYFIVLAIGGFLKYAANRVPVPFLKGEPMLDVVIKHIQTEYPEFWQLVFANLVEGLDLLWKSSAFIVAALLIIAFYTGCLCCCCPYRKPADEKEKS